MDLRGLRKARGFTQLGLAKAVGISQAMYSNIENGHRRPSVETAKLLGVKLGIDWYELFEERARGEG